MSAFRILLLLGVLGISSIAGAQELFLLRSENSGTRPSITWFMMKQGVPKTVEAFRTDAGSSEFSKIATFTWYNFGHDTAFLGLLDTTLTRQGLYKYYIAVTFSTGPIVYSEVAYGHNMGYLPHPAVTGFKAVSAANRKAMVLSWKLNYAFTVKTLTLFRSRHDENGFEPIAVLPAETETYTDPVQVSNEPYFYFLMVRDFFGVQLPSVVVNGTCTYAEPASTPMSFHGTALNRQVRLAWENTGSNTIGYRIYRKSGDNDKFFPAGPTLGPTANSFTDTSLNRPEMAWAAYYLVAVSDGFLESAPTDTLSFYLSWNVPFGPPADLDAIGDSAGHPVLYWTSQAEEPAVKGYNLYRAPEAGAPVKVNRELIPVGQNSFTDTTLKALGNCTYSIESVNTMGEPSSFRTETGFTATGLDLRIVLQAIASEGAVELSWLKPDLVVPDSYYIYRKSGSEPAKMAGMINGSQHSWTDSGLTAGTSYIYTMVAELKDGTRILVNEGVLVSVP